MRTGVFGGTFNPIHNGHLHIAKCFASQLSLDRVIFIPARRPTHKESTELLAGAERLALCRLAVEGTPFLVSDLELTRREESYTVYTLEQLQGQYPDDTLLLLVGEDMFLTLLDWKDPARILQLAEICVAPRSTGNRAALVAYGARIEAAGGTYRIADIPFLPISSTQIRSRLRDGLPITGLVPEKVERAILDHHFYTGGFHL